VVGALYHCHALRLVRMAVLFAITANGPPGRGNGGNVAGYDAVTGAQVLRVRVLAGRTGPPGMNTAVSGRLHWCTCCARAASRS